MRNSKRVLALLLAALMVSSSLPLSVFSVSAETAQTDLSTDDQTVFTSEEGYLYRLQEDGTAEICGYGPQAEESGKKLHLSIPEEVDGYIVTALAEEAFARNESIETVVLPASLTRIGNAAFYHCDLLKAIVFSGEAMSFGFTVAEGCHSLESVYALKNSDVATFCALLVSDLGTDGARAVDIFEYENVSEMLAAYQAAYVTISGNVTTDSTVGATITVTDGAASNACGENATWTLDADGTLTVSGSGPMYDYDFGETPWYEYRDEITKVVIEDGITTICHDAFYYCQNLTELVLGQDVTEIGDYAFECSGLTGEVVIPDSVVIIGNGAFMGTAITSVVIGKGVARFGYGVFTGCFELAKMTFRARIVAEGDPFELKISFDDPTPCALAEIYVPAESYDAYVEAYEYSMVPYECNATIIPVESEEDDTADFIIEDGVLTGYVGECREVIIPDGVTAISEEAFSGNTAIAKVLIPEGVTSIKAQTFMNCSNLIKVVLPATLTSIGDEAFSGCNELSGELVIPEGVTDIGSWAFAGCAISRLSLPSSLKTIGERAFTGCNQLYGTVTIPEGVTALGNWAFAECTILYKVVLPSTLNAVGEGTFNACSYLSEVVLPSTLECIGDYAFEHCTNLTDIDLPSSLTEIGAYAFCNCIELNGKLTIPEGVTSIGSYAYDGCSSLTGVILPSTLETIEESTFGKCTGFTDKLVIPEGVIHIGVGAFVECAGITELVLPSTLESMEETSFLECSGIKKVTFLGETVPKGALFNGMNSSVLTTVYVPAASYDAYVEAYEASLPDGATIVALGESDFIVEDGVLTGYLGEGGEIVIPDGVTAIGEAVFKDNTALTKVTLPEGVTEIASNAFSGCSMLTEVVLPSTLTYIGAWAFADCISLTELVFPDSVTEIGEGAFMGCTALTGVVLPSKLTVIEASAFENCTSLAKIDLPSALTTIGDNAFYYCSGLSGTLAIPDSVTTIGDYAFYHCDGLTGLDLGEGVREIGGSAFLYCWALTGELVIPDSVTTLGIYVFHGCSQLTALSIGKGLTYIEYSAFQGLSNVTELVIPDSVTEIGDYTFSGMDSLTSVVVGKGVTTFGNGVFMQCPSVTTVTFRSPTVPEGNPFEYMESYEDSMPWHSIKVYVPAQSYDAYYDAYAYAGYDIEIIANTALEGVSDFAVAQRYSKTAVLTWSAHSDDAVVGYLIKRDGEVVADTTALTFTDTGLTAGTTYTYTVSGYTADGEYTDEASVTVTPVAPVIESIATENGLDMIGADCNAVEVTVRNDGNMAPFGDRNAIVKLYLVRSGVQLTIGEFVLEETFDSPSVTICFLCEDTGMPDGEYELVVELTDADGTTVTASKPIAVDYSLPEQIVNVTAVGAVDAIYLNWSIAAEIDTTYRIYRKAGDGAYELLAEIDDRNTLSYTDTDVAFGVAYTYYVVGVDAYAQQGEASEPSTASLAEDREAPVVTKLTPANYAYLSGTVQIGVSAQDNLAVTQIELYYSLDNGETWIACAASGDSLSTPFDTTAVADGLIRFKAVAYDAAGNKSAPTTYLYTVDNNGPEQVTGLSYVSTSVIATLSWNDVSDNDISFFRVEIRNADGSYSTLGDSYSSLGINLYGLTPATAYTYRVVGYDTQGNRGIPSEDITVTTQEDTSAPVITQISPTAGYYADAITVSFTAKDDHGVAGILLQISTDRAEWTDLCAVDYEALSASQTLSHTLDLSAYAEGTIYLRAIATDAAGNESLSDATAPFVQYIIDRSAPEAPQEVSATGNNGYITVAWSKGSESDLSGYSVYRSTEENGSYELVASVAALNWFDRGAEVDVTYYYKVAASDSAGNVSALSAVVSAVATADTAKPETLTVYPASGTNIGIGSQSVSVFALDNSLLDSILIEYSLDSVSFTELKCVTDIGTYNTTVAAELPIDLLANGDLLYLRVTVTDAAGNSRSSGVYTYVYDSEAPTVSDAKASFDGEKVLLEWKGGAEADLAGYRIYRKIVGSDSYALIGQKPAVADQFVYSAEDGQAEKIAVRYIYKIEAVDRWGNVASTEVEIALPDRSEPTAVLSCDSVLEVGAEYYIDASGSSDNSAIISYFIDFGDGTTSTERKAVHAYEAVGEYTVTLTVTDDTGLTSTVTKTVKVIDRSLLGTVTFKVVDENGAVVPGASVYFDLGEEDQTVKQTDGNGCVSFSAEAGKYAVGCIIPNNEWLPAKKEVVVLAGIDTEVTFTLVHQTMIEGSFEIERMTFEEIVAAGIDVTDPANQYWVNVTINLEYESETVSQTFAYNPVDPSPIDPIELDDWWFYPNVIKIKDDDDDDDNNGGGSGGGGGGGGTGGGYGFSEEVAVVLFQVPAKVSALKEFFDVKLHIINNASSEFSMLDNVVTLNLPEGLTIMETLTSESEATVTIPEIKGQTTQTISWIIRGDEVGKYSLTADYSGLLAEFDQPIFTQFKATDPIEVYGLTNMKLLVEVAETLDKGTLYYNMALINEGEIDIYLPTVNTPDVLIETELFDDRNWDTVLREELSAAKIDAGGYATSIEGEVGVLHGGYALRKHYMNVTDSTYTEKTMSLTDYCHNIQNSYGLEVEIKTKPLSYFKNYLNASVNAAEKAELTFTSAENQNAYEYIMNDANFMCWAFYAPSSGLESKLPSKFDEKKWELVNKDFAKLLEVENDEKLIQAIILETLELAVSDTSLSTYQNVCEWLSGVVECFDTTDLEGTLQVQFGEVGETFPEYFEWLASDYKWEAYQSVMGKYGDFTLFLVDAFECYIEQYKPLMAFDDSIPGKTLKYMLTTDETEGVWEGLGLAKDIAEGIVNIGDNAELDYAIFIAAQSQKESCDLFLDALIYGLPHAKDYGWSDLERDTMKAVIEGFMSGDLASISSNMGAAAEDFIEGQISAVLYKDATEVVSAAIAVKEKIAEYDPLGCILENIREEGAIILINELGDKAIDAALTALGVSTGGIVSAVMLLLDIGTDVLDQVFNISERFEIANSIRYISIMSEAMHEAIVDSRLVYASNKSDETAQRFMQMLYYMLNLRMIGESQVAELGVSYEVMEGVFDSEEMFVEVKTLTGHPGVTTWYEWRDEVEDHLSGLRVRLFKNPVTTQVTGLWAPLVSFDYAKGQTAQSFSSAYQYSLSGGEWITCDGGPIKVAIGYAPIELRVKRIDTSNTDQWGTAYCTVYGIPSLRGNGIYVQQTADGYRIENLDSDTDYEVTFSSEALEYSYGEALAVEIPEYSSAYEITSAEEYDHIYIRSVADGTKYASDAVELYVKAYEPPIETEHSYGEWVVITAPTCTEAGGEQRACVTCGEIETRTVDALGHSYTDEVIAPTTQSEGYTLHTCTVCGDSYKDSYVDAPIPGDADGDGTVSMKDATLIQQYLNGWDAESFDAYAADVNNDGMVDLKDAILILQYLNGWGVVLN